MDVKTTIVSLAAIGTVVAGVWAIDARYALAADMRSLGEAITRQIEINRLTSEANTLELRRAALMDKVFDGAAKSGKKTVGEKTSLERYDMELKDVDRTLRDKRIQIDQMRAK